MADALLLASHYVTSQEYLSKDENNEQIRETIQSLSPNDDEKAAILRRDTQIDNNKDILSRWGESRDASGNYKVYIAGSEHNFYNIIHEITETKVVKTEITIYFYFYKNQQFSYIKNHQTTFDILKSVLAKYPHYFYNSDRTGDVGNREWYINNLIMIPGGEGRFIRSEKVNIHHKDEDNDYDTNEYSLYPDKVGDYYHFDMPSSQHYKGKDINVDIGSHKNNHDINVENVKKNNNLYQLNIPKGKDYKGKDINIDIDDSKENYQWVEHNASPKDANDDHFNIPHVNDLKRKDNIDTNAFQPNYEYFDSDGDNKEDSVHEKPRAELMSKSGMQETDYDTFYPEQNEKGYYEVFLPSNNNYRGKDINVDILRTVDNKKDVSIIENSSQDNDNVHSYISSDVKSFPSDNYNIFDVDYVAKQEINSINPSHTNSIGHLKGKETNLPNNKNDQTNQEPDAKVNEELSTYLKNTNSNDDNSELFISSPNSKNMDTGHDYEEQLPERQEKGGRYNPYNVRVEDIPLSNEHNIDESDVNISADKMAAIDVGDKGIENDALPYVSNPYQDIYTDNQEFSKNLDFIKMKELNNLCSQINQFARLPHTHNINKEDADIFLNSNPNLYPSITAATLGAIRDISPCLRSLILNNRADLKLCEEATRAKIAKYFNTKPLQTSYKPTFFQKPYESTQLSPNIYLPQESFASPRFDLGYSQVLPNKYFSKNDYPFSYEPKIPHWKVHNPIFPINGFLPSSLSDRYSDILQQQVPLTNNNNIGGIHPYSKHYKTNFDTENKRIFAQQDNNGNLYDSFTKQLNSETPSDYFNFNPPFSQNKNSAAPFKLDSTPLFPKSSYSVIPMKNENMFYQPGPIFNYGLTWPPVSNDLNLPSPYTNKNTGIKTPKNLISPAYRPLHKNIISSINIPENHPQIINNVLNNGIHFPTPPQAYFKEFSEELYPVLSPQYDKIPVSFQNGPLNQDDRYPETQYTKNPIILQKGIPSLDNSQPQYSPEIQYGKALNIFQKGIPSLANTQPQNSPATQYIAAPNIFQKGLPGLANPQPQNSLKPQYGTAPNVFQKGIPSLANPQPQNSPATQYIAVPNIFQKRIPSLENPQPQNIPETQYIAVPNIFQKGLPGLENPLPQNSPVTQYIEAPNIFQKGIPSLANPQPQNSPVNQYIAAPNIFHKGVPGLENPQPQNNPEAQYISAPNIFQKGVPGLENLQNKNNTEAQYGKAPNIFQKVPPGVENPQPQNSPATQYIAAPNFFQKGVPGLANPQPQNRPATQIQQPESSIIPYTFERWPVLRNQQPQTQYGKLPLLQGFPPNVENQQPLIQHGNKPLTYDNNPPVNSLLNVTPSKYLQNTLNLPKTLNHANQPDKLNSYTPNESQLRLMNKNQQPMTVPMNVNNINSNPKTFGESSLNPVSTNLYKTAPNLTPLFQYQPHTLNIPAYMTDKSTFPESKLKSNDKQRVLQDGFAYNSPHVHVLNPIHRFAPPNSIYNNKLIANTKEYAPKSYVYEKHSLINPINSKGNSKSTQHQNVNPQMNQPIEYNRGPNMYDQNMWLQNFSPNHPATLDKQKPMTLSQPEGGPSQFINTLGYPVAYYSPYLKQPYSFAAFYPCLKPFYNLKTENYFNPTNILRYQAPNIRNFHLNNPEYINLPETMNSPLISAPISPTNPTTYFSRLNPDSPFITKINRLPQMNVINVPYNSNIHKPLYTENLASLKNSRGQLTPIKTIQTSPETQKLDSNKNYPYLNYPSQFRRPLNSKESFIRPGQSKLYSDASNRQLNKLNTYMPSAYFKPSIAKDSKSNYEIPNLYISNKQSRLNDNIPILKTLSLNNYQSKKSKDNSTKNAYPYYNSLNDKIPHIYPSPIHLNHPKEETKPINSLSSSPLLTQMNSPMKYPNIPGFLNNILPNKYGAQQNPEENPFSINKYYSPIKNYIPNTSSNRLENPKDRGQESKESYPMIHSPSIFDTDRPIFENIPHQYPYLPGIINNEKIDYPSGSQFSPGKYYNPNHNNNGYVNQSPPIYPYHLGYPKTQVPSESNKPMYGNSPNLLSNNPGYISPDDKSNPKIPLMNNKLPSNNFDYENTIQEKPKLPGPINNPIISRWPYIKAYDSRYNNHPEFNTKVKENKISNPYTTINPYAPHNVQFQNPYFPRILNSQLPDSSQNYQSDYPKDLTKAFDSITANLNPKSTPYINSYNNIPSNPNPPRFSYNNKNENTKSQSIPYKSINYKPVTDHTLHPKLPKNLQSISTIPPSIYNLKDLLNNKINQEIPNILTRQYFDNNFNDPNPNAYDNIKINLGNIAVAKYNNENRYLIKTDNPNVNLLAWKSKIKTINAKLIINVQDYPAMNFMPVINGPISPEEGNKIARDAVTRLYGEPIVVNGQFSSYEPYGVVFNEGEKDSYNILWPTLCNCGCMRSGCKCQCRN